MKFLISFLIFISAGPAFATSGNVVIGQFKKKPQLKYGVSVEPHIRASTEGVLDNALVLVTAAAQEKADLLPAEGQDFDFIIEITDRRTIQKKYSSSEQVKQFTNNLQGDAYSIIVPEVPNSPVIVRVLWDEVMFISRNGQYQERPDAFARLVTLLGHEVLGNVQSFVKNRNLYESVQFRHSQSFREEAWLKSEVTAFSAGVEFLETLIAKFSNVLPDTMIQDFKAAKVREQEALASYNQKQVQSQNSNVTSLTAVKACARIFQSN